MFAFNNVNILAEVRIVMHDGLNASKFVYDVVDRRWGVLCFLFFARFVSVAGRFPLGTSEECFHTQTQLGHSSVSHVGARTNSTNCLAWHFFILPRE